MSEDYKGQLKRLLRKLFQFDYADLDFGIYRIMNKKRDEIERFIEEDLIDAVDAEFGGYVESKGKSLKEDVESIKSEIREKLGDDAFDESDKIKPLYVTTPFAIKLAERYEGMRAAMKESDMSDQHEGEIFSHIHQFFSRYYDNGDFMSLRRYSQKEKYAIPYNGEEVVLHWANKDQYYIKTGEYFRNYSFKMGDYTVEFRILEAEDTTNNNKTEKRFFVLASSGDNVDYDDSSKTLTIFFEYRGLSKDEEKEYGPRNVQEAILAQMKEDIPAQVQDSGLKGALNKVVDKGKETEKTVLEKHLRAYTKKNTTDYFIHKDLKGFLTQELDFYIKNEVFHLDDLGTENEVGVEQYVSRVRVMKSICLKVIDFLAQIEDFQKMLFEKKKFVVRTDYCITLDNVPEDLYPEILENEVQINEWRVLYGIRDEEQVTLGSFGSEGIDEAYLREQPYLVVDTKFFNQEFKDRLLISFDDIDETVGGLLVNSENWQALNLMHDKYGEKVKCIYIDPPYNTGSDGFVYKDNYMHSSWLTLMRNRISTKDFLSDDGVIFISIDDGELANLKLCLNQILHSKSFVADVCVVNNLKGRNDKEHIATANERLLIYKSPKFQEEGFELTEKQRSEYSLGDQNKNPYRLLGLRKRGGADTKELRPNLFFPIYVNPENGDVNLTYSGEYSIEVLPLKSNNVEGCWRWGVENFQLRHEELVGIKSIKGKWDIFQKDFLFQQGGEKKFKPKSVWFGSDYSTDRATKELRSILPGTLFTNPKPVEMLESIIKYSSKEDKTILDFFAGSGTTAHAVINLNRKDKSRRKYILIEMGEYFNNVLKPRLKKVINSSNWKDGKPQSTDGISHIFKYQTLEQYEDTLNNIEFTEAGTVQRTLTDIDDYFLRYMLDFDTRDSPCRFNVVKLDHPFSYTLKITEGSELKEQTVDLVETFNYLLGLHVRQIRTFTNNGTYYRVVLGRKDENEIAIIWRDTENIDLVADKEFIEGTILNGIDSSKTFINSDFFVEGAHPIEPEFKKLMVV